MVGLAARAVLAGDELLRLLPSLWWRSGGGNNEKPFHLFSRHPVALPLFPHQVVAISLLRLNPHFFCFLLRKLSATPLRS